MTRKTINALRAPANFDNSCPNERPAKVKPRKNEEITQGQPGGPNERAVVTRRTKGGNGRYSREARGELGCTKQICERTLDFINRFDEHIAEYPLRTVARQLTPSANKSRRIVSVIPQ